MSFLKTKPRWTDLAEATEAGWVNRNTGELLVSIRGLKSKLEAEQAALAPVVAAPAPEVIIETVVTESVVTEAVVTEAVVKKPRRGQKLIAEVVEYNIAPGQSVIGE